MKRIFRDRLLVATTIFPTVISIIYFGFVASDLYVSESRFVIRSPSKEISSPLGVFLKGAGISKAQDDSYVVQEYITSRDALKLLDEELKIRASYSSHNADYLSRFASFGRDDGLESFYEYFEKKINLKLDSASSISTLYVKAFTAEEAKLINDKLVDLAEQLVNKINYRAQQDAIKFAHEEVANAEKKAKEASYALAQYRKEKGVLDPEKESQIPLQQIGKLQDELVAAKAQLSSLQKLAYANPQIPSIKQRIAFLEAEIASGTERVTGGERSLSGKAVNFHRLSLEKEFSERLLVSAMNYLEQARYEAQKKQLYLEVISKAHVPDKAVEPKRLQVILGTFLIGLVLWGVSSILVAGVMEHHDH